MVTYMSGRTVMVTGGAGFIGSNLVDRFLAQGDDVVAVDTAPTARNLATAPHRAPGRFRLARVDVTEAVGVDAIVAATRPELICHLAAQINVRASVADPLHDANVNVVGTVAVLEAARRHGVRKVVFATSGGCIYGEPDERHLPIPETYPGHAHSPYGAAKRAADEYLRTYGTLYGLAWTSLALSNVYGRRQDPAGEAGVVAMFLDRMLADAPVTINGDGRQTRDFVHVDDVTDAFVRAAHLGDGQRINIGTGRRTSVNELCETMLRLTGSSSPVRHGPPQPGDLRHSSLDRRRARQALGWAPTISLVEGLRDTIAWTRSAAPVVVSP